MVTNLNIQYISIEDLDLDKENPRIRKWIEQYGDDPSFDQMLLALGAGTSDPEAGSTVTFQSLRDSIRTQGGVINPIIVKKASNGRYLVVEGNTRVAIYRKFFQDKIPGQWNAIPAIVHDGLEQTQIDAIRLQCHIVGPRPWDPYSKAKYLDHLLNVENMSLSKLVDLCGGRKKEITDYIDAYKDMEGYYRPVLESDSDFDPNRFSAFVELQRATVKAAILEADFTLTNFAEWVRDLKIDPLNTVRALPRILKHPQARAKFLAVGARAALKVLDVPVSPAVTNVPLDQLLRVVIEKIHIIPWPQVEAMKKDINSEQTQLIIEAQEALAELCKQFEEG